MKDELYAAVYAQELPAQALLRLSPELCRKPLAVLAGEPPLEHVCSANELAYAQGVQLGMTRLETEAFAYLVILRRSPAAEQSSRTALLECVQRFSPRVEEIPFHCALAFGADLRGTKRLLGEPQEIAGHLQQQALQIGIRASVAVSGNLHAALCWTRGRSGTSVLQHGDERNAISPLPISVLNLSVEQRETLELWGIRTLGSLAALPEKELIARLGQDGKRLRQLAAGEHSHLLQPLEEEPELEEAVEFDIGLESLDSVMFVVSPMLQQLVARAASRALALVAVTITCALEDGKQYVRTIRSALPTIDEASLLRLLHLDLIANPAPSAVRGIRLYAEVEKPNRAQLGLFAPQFPEPMRLEVTLARLAAVVGSEGRVGAPELRDSHEREAFRIQRFVAPENACASKSAIPFRFSALRILRPPETVFVKVVQERPRIFVFQERQYQVLEAYGPWAASGAWWKPEHWVFQQWDVIAQAQNGIRLFCQIAHDLKRQQWQMEALYD